MVFQSIFLTEYLHIGVLTLLVTGTTQLYQYQLHIVGITMFLVELSVRLHALIVMVFYSTISQFCCFLNFSDCNSPEFSTSLGVINIATTQNSKQQYLSLILLHFTHLAFDLVTERTHYIPPVDSSVKHHFRPICVSMHHTHIMFSRNYLQTLVTLCSRNHF